MVSFTKFSEIDYPNTVKSFTVGLGFKLNTVIEYPFPSQGYTLRCFFLASVRFLINRNLVINGTWDTNHDKSDIPSLVILTFSKLRSLPHKGLREDGMSGYRIFFSSFRYYTKPCIP